MKQEIIESLTKNFESYVNKTENDIEFWFARDLQILLGYAKWDNFIKVISKAKTACEVAGSNIPDHFADVGKTIKWREIAKMVKIDKFKTKMLVMPNIRLKIEC